MCFLVVSKSKETLFSSLSFPWGPDFKLDVTSSIPLIALRINQTRTFGGNQNQVTAWCHDSHSYKQAWAEICSCWNPNWPAQEDFLLRARQGNWVCPFLPEKKCSSQHPLLSEGEVQGLGRRRVCLRFREQAVLDSCFATSLYHFGGLHFPFLLSRSFVQALCSFWFLQGLLPPAREQHITSQINCTCCIWFTCGTTGLVCTTVMIVGASWSLSCWVVGVFTGVTCANARIDVQCWKCRFYVHSGKFSSKLISHVRVGQ